jgi:uncharacterized membrane protein
MSQQAASAQPRMTGAVVRGTLITGVIFGIIGAALGPTGFDYVSRRFAEGHPHAPDLSLIVRAPLVIQLHLATVLLGFGIGTAQMVGLKGTPMHRALGWTFVLFMLFTALDALFIKDGPTWRVTPIQLFSLMVLIGMPFAVLAARRRNVASHARAMRGLYFGGLFWAGLLAFIPGRLMWNVFFG